MASQRVFCLAVWNIGMHDVRSQSFHYHRGRELPRSGAKIRPTTLSRNSFRILTFFFCPFSDPLLFTLIELFYLETVWLAKTTTWRSPISVWRGWSRRTSTKPGSGPGSRSSGPRLKQPTTAGNKSRQSWLKLDMIEVKYGIGVFWGCKLFRVGIQL